MAAPVVYAGLAIGTFAIGHSAKRKAERAEQERIKKQAWADYGMTAFEFETAVAIPSTRRLGIIEV